MKFLGILLIFVVVLGAVPLVIADGSGPTPLGTFDLQGAKIVSEDGYFWLSVTPTTKGMHNFTVDYSPDFTFVKLFTNNNWVQAESRTLGSYHSVIAFSCIEFQTNELLFFAPWLQGNTTTQSYLFAVQNTRTDIFGVWSFDESVLNVEVVSLKTYEPSIPAQVASLEKEIDFLQMQVRVISALFNFSWSEYCNNSTYVASLPAVTVSSEYWKTQYLNEINLVSRLEMVIWAFVAVAVGLSVLLAYVSHLIPPKKEVG